VVHTHSPYATALASAGRALPTLHDEGRLLFGESIPLAKPAPPGTWELAGHAVEAVGGGPAALLFRHGAVTVGRTLSEALVLAEKLEEAARLLALALPLRSA
jgi:L-fuculose-phosphate aldolase